MTKKLKAQTVFDKLSQLHPDAHCELEFSNPLELLIATILSAQCTDVRVNLVTRVLFKKCKRISSYLKLTAEELEKIIHSAGFYKNKAKNILGAVAAIDKRHGGEVPRTMEELTALPGVGRKTANVVLSNAFNLPGLPVDTHVTRLANRIGLTKHQDAVKIESELCKLLPPKNWGIFSHLLIFHGRRICMARKPDCARCPLKGICRYYQNQ